MVIQQGRQAEEPPRVSDEGEELDPLVAMPQATSEDSSSLGARGEREQVSALASHGLGEGRYHHAEVVTLTVHPSLFTHFQGGEEKAKRQPRLLKN